MHVTRANETAAVIANYIRLLGYDAKSHSSAASDVDFNKLALCAGLVWADENELVAPYIGKNFGLGVITTSMELATDRPLAPRADQPWFHTQGPAWWLGKGFSKNAFNRDPFSKRKFVDGPHPFEKLKRVDTPTTYIDEERVARVPKRSDMFRRAQFGDMGKDLQEAAKGGHYTRKAAPSSAQRRALGAFTLLQDGDPNENGTRPNGLARNAANIKAACYFLGVDAVGCHFLD